MFAQKATQQSGIAMPHRPGQPSLKRILFRPEALEMSQSRNDRLGTQGSAYSALSPPLPPVDLPNNNNCGA